MTTDRKPSAAFWITVALVAVLVGYPLSFGPACWLVSWTGRGSEFLPTIYHPMLLAWESGPHSLGDALLGYTRLGARHGWQWTCGRNPSGNYDWVWSETW